MIKRSKGKGEKIEMKGCDQGLREKRVIMFQRERESVRKAEKALEIGNSNSKNIILNGAL